MLSPNVSVIANTIGTTEGDTVTLQCEDGLFPVIPVMITCNSADVWSPNPTDLVCKVISGMYVKVTELSCNKPDLDTCSH